MISTRVYDTNTLNDTPSHKETSTHGDMRRERLNLLSLRELNGDYILVEHLL